MKRIYKILVLFCTVLPLKTWAQEDDNVLLADSLSGSSVPSGLEDVSVTSVWHSPYYGIYPSFLMCPSMIPVVRPCLMSPFYGSLWEIHKGFNASVDMGVSVGFGKNNPWRGAHFFTSLAALYAHPVNDRLTLAAGAEYTRFTGWGGGRGSLGVFALANYRINERLDVTGFVSHDLGQLSAHRIPTDPVIPGYTQPTTTIGADLGIKVGENTKINLGVSISREHNGNANQDFIERQHRALMREDR